MRTPIDIDDDILALARSISKTNSSSLGFVVSEFARQGIQQGAVHKAVGVADQSELDRKLLALGVIPFARNPETPLVTDELVRELQNNEGL